jgi:hypothetical protein
MSVCHVYNGPGCIWELHKKREEKGKNKEKQGIK